MDAIKFLSEIIAVALYADILASLILAGLIIAGRVKGRK